MTKIVVIYFTFCVSILFGQNWTGAINSDWNNSSNWSAWPLNGEDLVINPANYSGASASPIISTNSVFSPAEVIIENGATLTINANLTTVDDVECAGIGSSIVMNSGTFSVNPGDGGRLIIDLEATFTLNNGTLLVDERFIAGENTLVTINNGTATSGERLIMDLGGQFHQFGGTVNVAQVFAMADGSALQPSGYILNDGNLNITGEFGIECESGNFEPFFHQNGGVSTVNGDVFWVGVTPGSGRGYFILNDGVANINGFMENSIGSTMGMQVEVHNSSVLNLNGTFFQNLLSTDSLIQTGNSTINIDNPNFILANQGVIYCEDGEVVIDGTCSIQGNGSFQFHNLEILNGGILNHVTTSPISIGGDLIHQGTFTPQNHQIVFNGNTQQSISGTTLFAPFDLSINNSGSGVQLNNSVLVSGQLNLMNGIVFSSISQFIKLTSGASSTSGNSNSFVSGPMEKEGSTAFVFPIGKNGEWARLGISAPNQLTNVFRAEYFNSSYSSLTPVNSPLSAVSGIEYWNLEQLNGSSQIEVDLYWEDASASAITDCNELSIGHWNGSSWNNEIGIANGTCSGNGAGIINMDNAINSFGIFTFGFYSGVTTQSPSICFGSSFTVGANNYNTSGTYVDILQDVNLNDSIVITALTVNSVNSDVNLNGNQLSADNQTADSYSWLNCSNATPIGITSPNFLPTQNGWYSVEISENGCVDTSACFYYTFVDSTICQGMSVTLGNNSYSNAGNYIAELTAVNASDSIVSLTLSVNSVNTVVQQNGITLSSSNVSATNYQWFDCTLGSNLLGETENTYTATENGIYALILEESGCVDTGNCITVAGVGIDELLSEKVIKVYPNPAKNYISIDSDFAKGQVTFYSISGELVHKKSFDSNQAIEFDLPNGVYFVEISDDLNIIYRQKLIVN